ncbi:MAG: lysine--tRNA ligase [candidate division WOR-3 bacterium]|nr:lysine--tRNA ligase [candidate division WOR-3 bacterium]
MDEYEIRKQKIEKLKELKINPYPYSFLRTYTTKEVKENFERLTEKKEEVKIAGRIYLERDFGKTKFFTICDGYDKIQIYFRKDILGEKYELLDFFDIGDYIGVSGEVFKTKTGEITILVKDFVLLSKALRPFGEKYHGIKDRELRYRQRYLDLLNNEEVKEVFLKRSKIVSLIREFLAKKGFIEVETPILQPLYGGAFATPFKTFYESLNKEFYLRISDELYLKRLLIGNLEKVYEIGKDFRNEGISRFHSPEFTQIEIYQAYADYYEMMELFEELFLFLVRNLYNDDKFVYGEKFYYGEENQREIFLRIKELKEKGVGINKINIYYTKDKEKEEKEYLSSCEELIKFCQENNLSYNEEKKGERYWEIEFLIEAKRPFKRIKFTESLNELLGFDILQVSFDVLKKKARELAIDFKEEITKTKLLDKLFSSLIQKYLIQPTFVMDHPKITTPLAKPHRENPLLCERFEVFIGGIELGNAFSEENDPERQKESFLELLKLKEDETPLDEDFIYALEYGMPPSGGLGIGIDRLVMILTNQSSIREVILFPQLKEK